VKLNETEFKTAFIAARLGQQSKSLDNLGDPSAITKAVNESKASAEAYWNYVQGIEIATTPPAKKTKITAEQWEVLGIVGDFQDLLNDFEKGFVRDRLKAGEHQKLTPKQIDIIVTIIKKIEA